MSTLLFLNILYRITDKYNCTHTYQTDETRNTNIYIYIYFYYQQKYISYIYHIKSVMSCNKFISRYLQWKSVYTQWRMQNCARGSKGSKETPRSRHRWCIQSRMISKIDSLSRRSTRARACTHAPTYMLARDFASPIFIARDKYIPWRKSNLVRIPAHSQIGYGKRTNPVIAAVSVLLVTSRDVGRNRRSGRVKRRGNKNAEGRVSALAASESRGEAEDSFARRGREKPPPCKRARARVLADYAMRPCRFRMEKAPMCVATSARFWPTGV